MIVLARAAFNHCKTWKAISAAMLVAACESHSPVPYAPQGITWPGTETVSRLPYGLSLRPMDFYLDFLREERFNAIRLPIAHQSVLDDAPVTVGQFDPRLNPHLLDPESEPGDRDGGLLYQDAILALAKRAATRHMLVVISGHRLKATHPNYGLWYNNTLGVSEESAGRSWDQLAAKVHVDRTQQRGTLLPNCFASLRCSLLFLPAVFAF